MKVPTKEENPKGHHIRYEVKPLHKPRDPGSEYFVLRLDAGGSDHIHIRACRMAILTYADHIAHHLPELAEDLRVRYGDVDADLKPK